jgi:TldD protein
MKIAFDNAPGPRYAAHPFARLAAEPTPLLAEPVRGPDPGLTERAMAELALKELKRQGVAFGDLRLGRDFNRNVAVQDDNLSSHFAHADAGIGVRALVNGFWGFSATSELTADGITRCAAQAASMARAVAAITPKEQGLDLAKLAHEPAHEASFHTPVQDCPFAAPVNDLAAPFVTAGKIGLEQPSIKKVQAWLVAHGRRRIFASTDGAYILTTHTIVDSMQRFIAVANGTSGYRTLVGTAVAGGLEHVKAFDYPGQAAAACRDALAKCHAEKPAAGRYTLILDGHNLALTMHESVGHPTELDRVAGYELGFAGGSFASLDKLGHFQYGSKIVNFTANNKIRFGGASVGFDDEGVECQAFPLVKDGVLVGYGTSRETAHLIGATRANGTARSTSWCDTPIVRIPNLYLEPGKTPLSLEQLIADTDDGIMMLGRDSFSIDQMRYNFQFGADMSYRIRKGKLAEPLRDVIYQSISPDFWGSCDRICDASEWQMHGVFNCGKGQPIQLAKMMHGAAPARFRDIRVGY